MEEFNILSVESDLQLLREREREYVCVSYSVCCQPICLSERKEF